MELLYQHQDFLDQFRKKTKFLSTKSNVKQIYFKIDYNAKGYFVYVVDNKYKEIDVNYVNYSGSIYSVLRALDSIKEKNDFVIDWESDEGNIYLKENDYLLYLLSRCKNVISSINNPILFEKQQAKIQLIITESEKGNFESKIISVINNAIIDSFWFLCDNFIITEDDEIYEIQPVGNHFETINYFNTKITDDQIELFLSIFFSYIYNVEVVFGDFSLIETDTPIETKPIILFEKIDVDDALFIRVSQSVPKLSHQLFEQFELIKYVEINDLDKQIKIRNIDQQSIDNNIKEITKVIKKHVVNDELKKQLIIEDNLFILPKEIANNFIINDLSQFLDKYIILGTENLKSYKLNTSQPTLNVKLSHGIDFLEGDVNLEFGDESISLFDAIKQYNKQHYILLSDGSRAILNSDYIKKIERIFRKKKGNKVSVSFFDLPLIEDLIEEKINDSVFEKHRKIFEGFNNIQKKRTKLPEINATLRDYQVLGYKWINYLYENKLGGCLADDMGLGKTIQTISMFLKVYPDQKLPSLIIMPRSLLFNWSNEIEKFNPTTNGLSSYIYHGTERNFDEAMKHQLILTTYAIVRNDIEQISEKEFFYVVLDESQNIKNLASQTTKAVMMLDAKYRLALSGTPIENNLSELYSLFRFLNPAMFGTESSFNENYAIPIQKNNDKDAILSLRKKIYPFILRRLKKDVLKELPEISEQHLFVDMNDEQKRMYEQRRQFYQQMIKAQIAQQGIQKSQIYLFQALTELRQLASVPESKTEGKVISEKKELLMEYLLEAIANNHKAIVFTNFIGGIEIISEELDKNGIDFVTMTGSTRDRQKLVDRFQNDKNCKVFVMTLKTGGVGLNLTAADTVFIFDPWWNRAAEKQGIDRTHRIGQTKSVNSYRLIAKNTIEEKIMLLQQKKAELFDNLIGSDSASVKSLTEEDIDFILS